MNKQLIRKLSRNLRIYKSLDTYFKESNTIQKKLFSEVDVSQYKNIFIYLSSFEKREVDTWNIIPKLVSNNIFVPKIVNNEIKIAKYDKNFNINKFGIMECQDVVEGKIDLAIIPLLSFNKNLYRVGYGGGTFFRVEDLKDAKQAADILHVFKS